MAILENDNVESSQGFNKRIDTAGLGMVLDNMQKSQYSKPIPSTVRETASNSVDSMRERDIAKSILLGESKVEDHYVVREGEIYEASKFNPEYYNLDWLSDEKNVQIEYFERTGEPRDLLRFTDWGVGLGGKRLEGFFSLSYSTKRLNKSALGKFGIGAKAPLSTGVPSYKVSSYYNGRKFEFDIFSRHIQSLIPKWNEAGEENQIHYFEQDDYWFYSEPTDRKNGVVIELEIKSHNRSLVKESIQNQLLYFEGIEFKIYHDWMVNEEGEESTSWIENVPVTTEVYFENEYFIISKNNLYARPHIVLGTKGAQVNYGLIDFRELEMADVVGNVGIKGGDVEVNPSRESVVWSAETGEAIKKAFQQAQQTANEIVGKMLQENDYLKWIHKNVSLVSATIGSNPVLRELSGMINKDEINSAYPLDTSIVYSTFRKMVGTVPILRNIGMDQKYLNNKYRRQIKRTEISSWASASMEKLYFTRDAASQRKDAYIIRVVQGDDEVGSYSLISIPEYDDEHWKEREQYWKDTYQTRDTLQLSVLFKDDKDFAPRSPEMVAEMVAQEIGREMQEYQKAIDFLDLAKQSAFYHDYDALEVPKDWVDEVITEDDLKQATEEQMKQADAVIATPADIRTAAQRRKEQNRVVFKYASFNNGDSYQNATFKWTMKEEDADVLNGFDGTLVYATQAEWIKNENPSDDSETTKFRDPNSDEDKLKMVAGILGTSAGIRDMNTSFDKKIGRDSDFEKGTHYAMYPLQDRIQYKNNIKGAKDLMLIKVSKPLSSKLKAFIPVSKFLMDMDSRGKIFIHMKLVNWYTAMQLNKILQKLQFLNNFGEISPFHAQEWKELYKFTDGYYLERTSRYYDYPTEMQQAYAGQLDKLFVFQRMIKQNADLTAEEVAQYAVENFGTPATDAHVVDLDLIERAEYLMDWATPVVDMLNNISYFTIKHSLNSITDKEQFLEQIRHYMRSKSVEMKQLPMQVQPLSVLDEVEEEVELDVEN
jgi:hypothetical protein